MSQRRRWRTRDRSMHPRAHRRAALGSFAMLAALYVVACARPPEATPAVSSGGEPAPRTGTAEAETVAVVAEKTPPLPADPAGGRAENADPVPADAALLLTDPELLAELEARALSLPAVLGSPGAARSTLALQAANPLFHDFVELVSLDDSVARWRDPDADTGFRPSHRLFDIRWLSSTRTRFELVGIVNRADRVHASPDACGELRLIYRLAYTNARVDSRLPMTLNVVFAQPSDCAAVAKRWLALENVDRNRLEDALLGGPLAGLGLPRRLETNFQSGRWPSAVRPRLGGHAEYVLRSFVVREGRLTRGLLENTPTQKLHRGQRAELRRWLAAHVREIEAGTLVLPERFLAERSVSVQPRGIARLANRPFSQIAPLPDHALTRRLDQLSCKGCHASRSLAGFHLLGEDRADTSALNAVAVGASPHLLSELPWRRAMLEALAGAASGARPGEPGWPVAPKPIADRASGRGLAGEACGTGRDRAFADWRCAPGLRCKDRHGGAVGTCARAGASALGEGVELGTLTQDRDAMRDTMRHVRVEPCAPIGDAEAQVARSGNGFPAGLCHAPCERFGLRRGDAICGPVPFGKGTEFDGFTKCLAVHEQPFERCLADDTHPTWLAHCDRSTPCRHDYLCVRVEGGEGTGACLPPYFLFQVRVDGHFVERW